MSTLSALVCDEHKEIVWAFSVGGGGVSSVSDQELIARFLYLHQNCTLRVASEYGVDDLLEQGYRDIAKADLSDRLI